MENMVNFSFRSKISFPSLLAVDPETLPIYKVEFFMTIGNGFQPLSIVVKISAGFLNPYQIFPMYQIDIGSILKAYEIDFLF